MNNFFGTDGIRTQVGTEPLTVKGIYKLGKAIAQWAKDKYASKTQFLFCQDTRNSCDFIKATLQSAILSEGINIFDAEILPTPALFHILKDLSSYTTGIIISASHNTYTDNGIKIVDKLSGKITYQDEKTITHYFSNYLYDNCQSTNYGSIKNNAQTFNKVYYEKIINLFPPNFLKSLTIVLDTAHGSTSYIAPKIFKKLGATLITINNKPNGKNINAACGALDPSDLQKEVVISKADIGFAFDGDGDRVIVINRQGEIKDGDDILALLSNFSNYTNQKLIIGTVMSNQGLEDYLYSNNKKLLRTKVGDKYILEKLNSNCSLGGEQSGHIILNDIISTGDGILVALKIIEAIIELNNWNISTFKKYPQLQLNIPIKYKKDLTKAPISSILQEAEQAINKGRLLARYSGTENLLRVMIEEADSLLAHKIGNQLKKTLIPELT